MIRTAARAKEHLGDSIKAVGQFLQKEMNPDGGFKDRDGLSDLYYSVFGIEGLIATRARFDAEGTEEWLEKFVYGGDLDLVHLSCLARCRVDLQEHKIDPGFRRALLANLEKFRSSDGGYSGTSGQKDGSAYGCFLALGTLQDMEAEPPDTEGIIRCLQGLRCPNGAYANLKQANSGVTSATAAAIIVLHYLGESIGEDSVAWLTARHRSTGGFLAAELAPIPDLLSTATALQALITIETDIDPLRQRCIDFVDSLWEMEGGFCGNWLDDVVDCEYTYYGLLALGNL